jgi:hypothetical protein
MSGLLGVGSKSGVIGTTELEYEEGTWIPVVSRVSSNPSGTPSVTGNYIKIGNLVYVQGYIILNGFSGGEGRWRCSLPFTASNHSETQAMGKGRIYMDGDSSDRQFRIQQNSNLIHLHTPSNDGSFSTNTTYLIWLFSGSYYIA